MRGWHSASRSREGDRRLLGGLSTATTRPSPRQSVGSRPPRQAMAGTGCGAGSPPASAVGSQSPLVPKERRSRSANLGQREGKEDRSSRFVGVPSTTGSGAPLPARAGSLQDSGPRSADSPGRRRLRGFRSGIATATARDGGPSGRRGLRSRGSRRLWVRIRTHGTNARSPPAGGLMRCGAAGAQAASGGPVLAGGAAAGSISSKP